MDMLNAQMSEIASLRELIVDMSKQLVQTNEQLMLMKQTTLSHISSDVITTQTAMPIHKPDDVMVETVESDDD